MNPKYLGNEELKEAFAAAKKAAMSGGGRIVSWSNAGTSVSKQFPGLSPDALFNRLAREIRHRIAEGLIAQNEFPQLSPLRRPLAADLYPKGIFKKMKAKRMRAEKKNSLKVYSAAKAAEKDSPSLSAPRKD